MAKKIVSEEIENNKGTIIGVTIPIVSTHMKPLLLIAAYDSHYYLLVKQKDCVVPETISVDQSRLIKVIKSVTDNEIDFKHDDIKSFNRLLNKYFVILNVNDVEYATKSLFSQSRNLFSSINPLDDIFLDDKYQVLGVETKSKDIKILSNKEKKETYNLCLNYIIAKWPGKKTESFTDDFKFFEDILDIEPSMVFNNDLQVNMYNERLRKERMNDPSKIKISYSDKRLVAPDKPVPVTPMSLTLINTRAISNDYQGVVLHNVTGVIDNVAIRSSLIFDVRVFLEYSDVINSEIFGCRGFGSGKMDDEGYTQLDFGKMLCSIKNAKICLVSRKWYHMLTDDNITITDIDLRLDTDYCGQHYIAEPFALIGLGINKGVYRYCIDRDMDPGDNTIISNNTIISKRLNLCSGSYYQHGAGSIGIALYDTNSEEYDFYVLFLNKFTPLATFINNLSKRSKDNPAYHYNVAQCNAFVEYVKGFEVLRKKFKQKQLKNKPWNCCEKDSDEREN